MRRRAFVAMLGGAAAWPPWPLLAQPAERKRRIGGLSYIAESDTEAQAEVGALREGLRRLGWTDGGNAQIDFRWTGSDAARARALAREIVALKPDVIVGRGTPVIAALREETRTIPIVFVGVADPVGARFVASMAHPGGNLTGFSGVQLSLGGKYLELLKEIAPKVIRVGLLFNPKTAPYARLLADSAAVAAVSLKVVTVPTPVETPADIEAAIEAFARQPNGGLVGMPDATIANHRALILALAARHRLPGLYPFRFFAVEGGLVSYGSDSIEVYRRAAGYVDRILRGEAAGGLPVQAPAKYDLVINLRTAKTLGLKVPATLLARADEVIE